MISKKCLCAAILSCTAGLSTNTNAAIFDMGEAGKLELNADAFIKGYSVNNNASSIGEGVSEKGAQSRVRLSMNMFNTSDWAMYTRLLGYYDWAGDRRYSNGAGSSVNDGTNSDSLSLDVAFLEYQGIDSWLFRAGRQEASWSYGFSIEDDRRDRIIAMNNITLDGGHMMLFGYYDLRFAKEHSEHVNAPNFRDDLNVYAIGTVGNYQDLDWGMQWAYFDGSNASPSESSNPYRMDDVHLFLPNFAKTMGNFSFKGAANIIFSDSNSDKDAVYFWGNDNIAAFLEGGYQFLPEFQLQAQVAAFTDGGLIGNGWDSYSLLINNDPNNEINPARTFHFGGYGNVDGRGEDGLLYGLRANWNPNEKLKLTFAIGHLDVDYYGEPNNQTESTFYDIKALYEFSQGNSIEIRTGHADGDLKDTSLLTTLRVGFG
ncbi:hypothetical protein [Vibrio sp. VB16]|uniref:hypothetical protein n=1 Tax=Vibrio sp. VB16 TaxID=2785746 RepID=UPI00189F3F6E|nr:hypothetical protein [Vibrio sp. VB16]UGA53661.1 hypothetical protein IUZ65_010185 [Vibrio sp. VB16]